ncbi:hypothetical protein MPLSOD_340050 [Mesorhizobium sp. SOD10]|nr:hypothetical protein MPLSOD_340050 [Mesorhizobium sp. SOD10]
MIRLDPATASPAAPSTVPGWAPAAGGALGDADAAFRAGAALGALDTLTRAQPACLGAWRERLALKCAAASMRLAGRAEDEAALRDAWQLCPAGAIPVPQAPFLAPGASWRCSRRRSAPIGWQKWPRCSGSPGMMMLSPNSAGTSKIWWRGRRRRRLLRRRSPPTSSPRAPTPNCSPGGSPTWCWRKACAGRDRCRS